MSAAEEVIDVAGILVRRLRLRPIVRHGSQGRRDAVKAPGRLGVLRVGETRVEDPRVIDDDAQAAVHRLLVKIVADEPHAKAAPARHQHFSVRQQSGMHRLHAIAQRRHGDDVPSPIFSGTSKSATGSVNGLSSGRLLALSATQTELAQQVATTAARTAKCLMNAWPEGRGSPRYIQIEQIGFLPALPENIRARHRFLSLLRSGSGYGKRVYVSGRRNLAQPPEKLVCLQPYGNYEQL